MKVTMSKIQERDLQVFMGYDDKRQQYTPCTVDMSDIVLIEQCNATLIRNGVETSYFTASEDGVKNAEDMKISCVVTLASTSETRLICFFADPQRMASVLYNRPADRDAVVVMYQTLDEFKIMKFFWDIANGNTRSPYTEAMMGNNK